MDTGGAVKGNRIDIFMSTYNEAIRFGRARCGFIFWSDKNRRLVFVMKKTGFKEVDVVSPRGARAPLGFAIGSVAF